MDLNMTANDADDDIMDREVLIESDHQSIVDTFDFPNKPDEKFKLDLVGGHDLTSMRSHFDQGDTNIIVPTERYLFYFNVKTQERVGKASIESSKLSQDEHLMSCSRLDSSLYLITNYGRMFVWSLDTRDWIMELMLPVNEGERLMSCKMLSKRQYIYTIINNETNQITLNYSMSRSERERPKSRENLGDCTSGDESCFDIGCMLDPSLIPQESSKANREKLSKQRCVTFIQGPYVHFQKISINEKLHIEETAKQRIADYDFTCVRANSKRPMVAAGDSLGRIYLYQGSFAEQKFTRTKLHWHSLPVNDLCFSSTGNTLFSVGGESGCVVVWDLSQDNLGKKRVIPRLGMPIRYINCGDHLNQLILSFEDNEIKFMDTNDQTKQLLTLNRRSIDIYRQNDCKALRSSTSCDINLKKGELIEGSVGLLWHSKTDTVVMNGKPGWLQFFSPKNQVKTQTLNFLKSKIFSLEKQGRVIPSEIVKADLSLDGDWIALYETRESESSFPEVKLHVWQRSKSTHRWVWIQTADRIHSSTNITDLKFSPDGQFLISVSDDGTFTILHRVCFDAKGNEKQGMKKQMYAKGFMGNVPEKLPAMATFSQDSSVMAMSLKNDTTLIWMIVDPFKLVYECQLNRIDSDDPDIAAQETSPSTPPPDPPSHNVLGLQFGDHRPTQSIAPLCEVRTNSIRVWNILNPEETLEYFAKEAPSDVNRPDIEFTAAAFDQSQGGNKSFDYFSVCTNENQILLFNLQVAQTFSSLRPLVIIDGSLDVSKPDAPTYFSHMCFLKNPILDIDYQCHSDPRLVRILNRLCLMNNHQELAGISDKLTLERLKASNSCNAIKTLEINDLQAYFTQSASTYHEETRDVVSLRSQDIKEISEKQRRIRKRLEVQKMLKDLLLRIPSQNLPSMEILGPMILDKLV